MLTVRLASFFFGVSKDLLVLISISAVNHDDFISRYRLLNHGREKVLAEI